MNIAILSCSLDQNSKSHGMGLLTADKLRKLGASVEVIDLRDYDLPMCDAAACYGNTQVNEIVQKLKDMDGIIIAAAIYNYDLNAAAKNIIELTGQSVWTDKVVGFVCAAGGMGSYMSVMGMANSLILDFHCLIVPQIVYAHRGQFSNENILTEEGALDRMHKMCKKMAKLCQSNLND